MAESQKQAASSKNDAPKEEASALATFTHADLIQSGPTAFGVPGHVVAGALNGEKANLTFDEAQKAINTFLGR